MTAKKHREPWPTNKRFRRFAALIADGCMFAVNSGNRIGETSDCCCPEGAALKMLERAFEAKAEAEGDDSPLHFDQFCAPAHPTSDDFCEVVDSGGRMRPLGREPLGRVDSLALLFAEGFDGEEPEIKPRSKLDRAAYRLGQEYRRRFVENANG